MKIVTVYLEDQEHKEVKAKKGRLTWREYLLREVSHGKNVPIVSQ